MNINKHEQAQLNFQSPLQTINPIHTSGKEGGRKEEEMRWCLGENE